MRGLKYRGEKVSRGDIGCRFFFSVGLDEDYIRRCGIFWFKVVVVISGLVIFFGFTVT